MYQQARAVFAGFADSAVVAVAAGSLAVLPVPETQVVVGLAEVAQAAVVLPEPRTAQPQPE